jgi:hypothetical protein
VEDGLWQVVGGFNAAATDAKQYRRRNRMKKFLSVFAALLALCVAQFAFAGQEEFCAGFEEGYKSIKGAMAMVPACPMAPMTPMGSTDFREGIKAGIRAAQGR